MSVQGFILDRDDLRTKGEPSVTRHAASLSYFDQPTI